MTSVNLIPVARRDARRRRVQVRFWIGASSAYAAIVLIVIVIAKMLWAFDNDALTRQVAAARSELERSESTIKELRTQLQQARQTWESNNAVGPQPDWSVLLSLLADLTDSEIVLRSCAIAPIRNKSAAPRLITPAGNSSNDPLLPPGAHGFTLHAAGLGRSQTSVTQFVLRLEQTQLFDQVRLIETRREPFLDSDAIAFRLECLMDGSKEKMTP